MPPSAPDLKELKAIVDWVNLTDDVRQLSITFADITLFISRDADRTPVPPRESGPAASPAPQSVASTREPAPMLDAAPAVAETPSSTRPALLAEDEVAVTAPMVGVFYSAPKPGDPPFVSVGDSVSSSTVVGIVEVMKLMNNLEAKAEGTVARILVDNEQAVEYGQTLLVIKRNG